MKNGYVVIGSGYGDEGKGLMTDYLAERHKATLTVRFNSGAQAGHSVCRGNKRHVFAHFGAASFLGVPTFLSKYFVVNPLQFRKEVATLKNIGVAIPPIYVDPECIVTTPYDIFMNHMNEKYRGAARHGSCGMGFNETVIRHLGAFKNRFNDERSGNEMSDPECRTSYEYLLKYYKQPSFVKRMHKIKKNWFWARYLELKAEGVFKADTLSEEELDILNGDGLITNYIADLEFLFDHTTVSKDAIDAHDTVVFEGAQGLQLAQDSGNFPHVTRSYTGRRNVKALLDSCKGYERIETVYVTRCYQTKHGAGPFEDTDISECIDMVDPTNQPNEFQGTIRTAYLNPGKLFTAIRRDIDMTPLDRSTASLAISCLDQIKNGLIKIRTQPNATIWKDKILSTHIFARDMAITGEMLGLEGFYISSGPSGDRVSQKR